jgi:hypothetical protein
VAVCPIFIVDGRPDTNSNFTFGTGAAAVSTPVTKTMLSARAENFKNLFI